MSTPGKVQVNAQGDTLAFQRFTPSAPVKIVTFAASWQILDGGDTAPNPLIGGIRLIL
jgi:hypothetical protein